MTKVFEQSSVVAAMQDDWDKVDTLMGGTKAMRAAGERFLPKWPQEDRDSYAFRLQTSTLYNAYGETVRKMAGKPFTENLEWDDVDPEIEALFDDIDLQGRNLQVFAHEVFTEALNKGLSHILAEAPVTKDKDGKSLYPTLEAEKKAGVRPYFVHVPPSAVLGWKCKTVNGVKVLTQLRILETVDEDDGEFSTKPVKQVRVLEPGRFTIWRKDAEQKEYVYSEGTTSLDFIPLRTVYTNRTGFMTAKPPLDNLADLNLKHWQSQSDQDSILHVARVPILAVIGITEGAEITIGSKAALELPPGADAKYVEHHGEAIEAGQKSLNKLEEQMEAMGAQLLELDGGDKTATESNIDSAEAECRLKSMAQALEDTLDASIHDLAALRKKEQHGHVTVFKDFSSDLTALAVPPFILSIISLVENGIWTKEMAFDEMKRRGVGNPDKAWKDVQAQIKAEAPVASVKAVS